jgi:hypothetical protein
MALVTQTSAKTVDTYADAPKLTEAEEYALKERMRVLDQILVDKGLAKYKLEAMFEHKHSLTKATFGILSFWQSGAKMHGGGDTKLYLCPGKDLKKNDCTAFIPDSSVGYGFLVCPACREVWQGTQVAGEVCFRLPIQHWASVLVHYFAKLEGNADVYLKYPRHDIRKAAEAEQQRQHMGDKLRVARQGVQKCIYPLRNIIKDTSNGADLYHRFNAFLRA